MLSELSSWQQAKLRDLFRRLDNNGDGRLEEGELRGILERLWVDTGWPESSRVVSHVEARWRRFLKSLFLTRTGLDENDWLNHFDHFLKYDRERRVASEAYRGPVEELAHLFFLLLDRDRDDGVDPLEFSLFFYALGHRDEDTRACFERLDRNGDGSLQRGEVEDMALEFFHGSEPGASGDWLFGPPPLAPAP